MNVTLKAHVDPKTETPENGIQPVEFHVDGKLLQKPEWNEHETWQKLEEHGYDCKLVKNFMTIMDNAYGAMDDYSEKQQFYMRTIPTPCPEQEQFVEREKADNGYIFRFHKITETKHATLDKWTTIEIHAATPKRYLKRKANLMETYGYQKAILIPFFLKMRENYKKSGEKALELSLNTILPPRYEALMTRESSQTKTVLKMKTSLNQEERESIDISKKSTTKTEVDTRNSDEQHDEANTETNETLIDFETELTLQDPIDRIPQIDKEIVDLLTSNIEIQESSADHDEKMPETPEVFHEQPEKGPDNIEQKPIEKEPKEENRWNKIKNIIKKK